MAGRGPGGDAGVLVESLADTVDPRSIGRARHGRWLTAFLAAVVLGLLAVAPATAASQTLVPACSGANIRTGPSTSSTVAVKLGLIATVTVSGTVSGSSWGTSCPTWKAGSSWYAISAINGQPVSSLYGVALVYGATGVLTAAAGGGSSVQTPATPPAPAPAPAVAPSPAPAAAPASAAPAAPVPPAPAGLAATTYAPGCSGVNLRTSASTTATIKARLSPPSTVTVSGTVSGSSWRATCPTSTSGSSWYVISAVNGQSVSTLYGVSFLYVATGVVTASTIASTAPATPIPTVPPTDTVAPTPVPTDVAVPAADAAPVPVAPSAPAPAPAAPTGTTLVPACDGVNLRASASTSAPIKVKLAINSSVGVAGTVTSASWSAACPTSTSGSTWYQVTSVNGQAVSTLYGVPAVYAATGVLTAPTTVPTAASTVPAAAPMPAVGPTTTFYGRGYGHGVGLSQYGARGRALAGQSATEILAHYYANTTIGSIATETSIRVLLLDNFAPTAAAPLTIFGRGGPWSIDAIGLEFPADARLRLFPPAFAGEPWRAVVDVAATQVLYDGPVASFGIRGATESTAIQLSSKPTFYDLFRGSLRVIPAGSTVDVVNELPLEAYLRGVVPAEMPTSWPLEARIAQTIVARSYAAYQLRPNSGTFDVYDDTRSQVYLGARQEKPDADAVVAATAGQVLRSGSAIVNALFHSSDGGATENNENVFVSSTGARIAVPMSYLRGSSDRDPAGVSYDAGAPYATWQTRAYTVDELSAIFAKDARTNVGTLTALDLRNRGVSGRLISVTLIGSLGTRTVSGAVFAAAFNAGKPSADARLRGTLVDVAPIP